jgi:AraC-like DNA-binding protein
MSTNFCLNIKVNKDDQETELFVLPDDLFLTRRVHKITRTTITLDTFGKSWILFFGAIPENKIYANSTGNWITLTKSMLIYVPSFSIIEWKTLPCHLDWWAISSDVPLKKAPQHACIVDRGSEFNLTTRTQIETIINQKPLYLIEKNTDPSPLSKKIKNKIDQKFTTEILIKNLIQETKASYSIAHSSFVKDFGLSPNDYLRRIRLFHSMDSIMCRGKEVLNSAMDAGLNNPSQIFRLYKQITDLAPNKYSWSNAKITAYPDLNSI